MKTFNCRTPIYPLIPTSLTLQGWIPSLWHPPFMLTMLFARWPAQKYLNKDFQGPLSDNKLLIVFKVFLIHLSHQCAQCKWTVIGPLTKIWQHFCCGDPRKTLQKRCFKNLKQSGLSQPEIDTACKCNSFTSKSAKTSDTCVWHFVSKNSCNDITQHVGGNAYVETLSWVENKRLRGRFHPSGDPYRRWEPSTNCCLEERLSVWWLDHLLELLLQIILDVVLLQQGQTSPKRLTYPQVQPQI